MQNLQLIKGLLVAGLRERYAENAEYAANSANAAVILCRKCRQRLKPLPE